MFTVRSEGRGTRRASLLHVLLACVGAAAPCALGQTFPCGPRPPASLPLDCGEVATTVFNGFIGANPSLGLDPNGPVLMLIDTRSPPPPAVGGYHWCPQTFSSMSAPATDRWTVANLGLVYGVTIDDATPPFGQHVFQRKFHNSVLGDLQTPQDLVD